MMRITPRQFCIAFAVVALGSALAIGEVPKNVLARVKVIFPLVFQTPGSMTDKDWAAREGAQAELKQLGPQADNALVELLKDAQFRDQYATSLFDRLLEDRDLVIESLPIVRQILQDFVSESSKDIRRDTLRLCEYLSVWGDDSDEEIMKACQRKADNRFIQQFIDQTKKFKELRAQGKPMPWEENPNQRTKFHQFGYTSAEWDALRGKTSPETTNSEPPQVHSTEKPLSVKERMTSDSRETVLASIESNQRGWLVWFAVVIVATGGAVWLFLRKSKS